MFVSWSTAATRFDIQISGHKSWTVREVAQCANLRDILCRMGSVSRDSALPAMQTRVRLVPFKFKLVPAAVTQQDEIKFFLGGSFYFFRVFRGLSRWTGWFVLLVILWFFLVFSQGFLGGIKGFSLCFRFFLMVQLHRWFFYVFLTDLTVQVVLCQREVREPCSKRNFRRGRDVLQLWYVPFHSQLLHISLWFSVPFRSLGLRVVDPTDLQDKLVRHLQMHLPVARICL